MNKATSDTAILSIALDRASKAPLQTQLLQALRELVHIGHLRPGSRLPSSRNFAKELAVSRVTTTAVYDQLIAEGYFEGRRGSGVYVVSDLPDIPIRNTTDVLNRPIEQLSPNEALRPFGVGYPDLSAFPYKEWTRLHDRVWRAPKPEVLGQSNPFGFGPLRTAIARHLNEWRGIHCSPEQIVITSGLAESLQLISRAALPAGSRVLVEDPGHKVLVRALTAAGVECEPVRVDDQGFNLSSASFRPREASAVAVTPSRQYPLGATLPLGRRLELLDWAAANDAIVLEDDYDGEFRYQGQPLPAMMSLDENQRVIYIGSFSKVMFPGLRLGYMVLPERLLAIVAGTFNQIGHRAAMVMQPVLAEFINEGALATHIRRMRRLYGERQVNLLKALDTYADGLFTASAETGGMHIVAGLSPGLARKMSDTEVSRLAQTLNLDLAPLSGFFTGPADQQGVVMGYAAYSPETISSSVRLLAEELRHHLQ